MERRNRKAPGGPGAFFSGPKLPPTPGAKRPFELEAGTPPPRCGGAPSGAPGGPGTGRRTPGPRWCGETVMLSVFTVAATPWARYSFKGKWAKSGTAFVCRLLVGQSSRGTRRRASSSTRRGSSPARTPWPMRAAPSSKACQTLSGPAASPAWRVKGTPRDWA